MLTPLLTIEHAPLLFGRDTTPGLVAFDLAEGGLAIRLYRRSGATTVPEIVPFSPFMLLADRELVKDAPGLLAVEALEGPGALRWRARFGSWTDALGISETTYHIAAVGGGLTAGVMTLVGLAILIYRRRTVGPVLRCGGIAQRA